MSKQLKSVCQQPIKSLYYGHPNKIALLWFESLSSELINSGGRPTCVSSRDQRMCMTLLISIGGYREFGLWAPKVFLVRCLNEQIFSKLVSRRCGKPLPCGHSCAAACGLCTKHTLEEEEKATPQGASHVPDAKALVTSALWRDTTALEQEENDEEMGARAAAKARVSEAAKKRTHHETCRIVRLAIGGGS